ncbi:MAG: extracellular solute-binding protein [Alphaproteobacteria bacterium]|uniref:extracellular solute-binding protein n=1 Tax=Maricaulis alexandrii TaxID=2570354 RepID=UPI001109DE05|nr:extracellular solute-binding protein [Maricaulis alexandrii]MCR9266088.1 extracellular solute-binding protein [Alphaproteobacteria bacterium]
MKSAISLAAAGVLAGLLAACSPSTSETGETGASDAPRVVNVYSARHYRSDAAVYAAFTETTGIEINLIEASGDQLIERVRADGARSPADVIITVDAARLHRAEEAGLFAQTDFSEFAAGVPDYLIDPDGYWIGFAKRSRVIAYSNQRVQPGEITTYEDLADPRWEGRVCVRESGNAYNQSLLASIIARSGEEAAEAWAAGIVSNMARAPQGGDITQIIGVAAGDCDVAITNHYYYALMTQSGDVANRAAADAVTLLFPNQETSGAHVNISGAGIAVNAPHPDEARELIAFLFSDEAQRMFAEMTNEIPVMPEAEWENPTLDAMMPFVADERNVSELGDHNATAQRIFDRVGWQ